MSLLFKNIINDTWGGGEESLKLLIPPSFGSHVNFDSLTTYFFQLGTNIKYNMYVLETVYKYPTYQFFVYV